MWTVSGLDLPPELVGKLIPEETLCYYDGPRTFTTIVCGARRLAHQCDEDEQVRRFVLSPISDMALANLRDNRLPLLDALRWPLILVVDVTHADDAVAVWSAPWKYLPKGVLPEAGVTLHPTTVVKTEVSEKPSGKD